MTTRQVGLFVLTCLAIFLPLGAGLFYSIPSNALSNRSSGGVRTLFNTIIPENWAFFTRDPESLQNGVYAFRGNTKPTNLLGTPQGRAANVFGISRTQRAQGPELGYLDAQTKNWMDCAMPLESCISLASERPPVDAKNASPVPTVCGDVYLTQERVVPWEYRDLVSGFRHMVKIAHLNVRCG
jgi:antimicrobial peptide system SdpA family protein